MQQFFESIKILDGVVYNLHLHIARMNRALRFYYPAHPLYTTWPIVIPQQYQKGLVECKVIYGPSIEHIPFEHYTIKPCKTYAFGHDDNINYSYKYTDRAELNMHEHLHTNYDEVIIVKHNMLTDATYSNVCLYDGKEWHTPKFPLLRGTMRQQLLNQGKIKEELILANDMGMYTKICFINAMNDLGVRVIDL
jgi:4-amino-4-deoxychorismate lyase